jgi:regulator of cell morphogenesis and NO signaling
MSTATQSIREIVSKQPSAAGIFHRFDIDLCLQADLSLEGACQELQLSVDQVLEKLDDAAVSERGGEASDPANLSLNRLIQHIVRVHHRQVRQILPGLAEMASKVAAKTIDCAPELVKMAELVENLRNEMHEHIEKEERVLFPFISQMDQESIVAYPAAHTCFRSITHPIFMMEQEHESADHIMAELIAVTNHFKTPSWACATHIALYSELNKYESDFKQHVHLENDILFPRAIQLEAELKTRNS